MSMKTPKWSQKDLLSAVSIPAFLDRFRKEIVTFDDSETSRVGELLHTTRRRCGFDMRATALKLRINLKYIAAIEAGRFEALPGEVYALGFVRAYADYLGLDGEEVIRLFKQELSQVGYNSSYALPVLSSDTGRPTSATLLLALTMGFIVYTAWYLATDARRLDAGRLNVTHLREVPEHFATTSHVPVGSAVDRLAAKSPSIPNNTSSVESHESVANEEGLDLRDQPGGFMAVDPETIKTRSQSLRNVTQLGAAPKTIARKSANIVAPTIAEVASKLAAQDHGNVLLGPHISRSDGVTEVSDAESGISGRIIRLRAISDGWIQVREGKRLLLTRFLKKGEVYQLPEQPGLTLMTSNAGGLEILIDGYSMSILRDEGAIKRGVAVNLDSLRSG